MGMQTFRGAGGVGAFSTPVARIDSDSLGECELAPLALDVLTEQEQRVERVLVGVATAVWIGIGALVVAWMV
jgi:hypothetical protein